MRFLPDAQLEAPGGPPPSCTTGLCMSPACQNAERTDIAHGCRFYAAQLDNIDSEDGKMMMLILTNSDPVTPANFLVELRSPDGWTAQAPPDAVPANGAKRIEVTRPLTTNGVSTWGAYRITSDSPILVTEIIGDDADRSSHSSSGTVLLPAHALDRRYMALTFPQVAGDTVAATPGSRGGAGVVAIVVTADRTSVRVAPKIPALVAGGIFDPNLSDEFVAVMDEGDVLQVFSDLPGGDLSGTIVDSDKPVSVFSGNVFTTYGHVATAFDGGDMAIEQMPPLSAWSNEYVGTRLDPELGCDPFLPVGGAMWQVVAAQDGTRVTVSLSAGTDANIDNTTFLTDTGFSLNQGMSKVFTTFPDAGWTGASPPTGDIIVTGSGPILLGQWLDCEPSLSLGMDTRLGTKTNMTIAFPPGFQQEVVITRRAMMPVSFDNYPIPDGYFQRVSTNYEYQVARLTQKEFGDCLNDVDIACKHTITSPLSGVALGWRGVDVTCSYAVTVPPSDPCVRPGCVQ